MANQFSSSAMSFCACGISGEFGYRPISVLYDASAVSPYVGSSCGLRHIRLYDARGLERRVVGERIIRETTRRGG